MCLRTLPSRSDSEDSSGDEIVATAAAASNATADRDDDADTLPPIDEGGEATDRPSPSTSTAATGNLLFGLTVG